MSTGPDRYRTPQPRWRCTIPDCPDNRWHHLPGATAAQLRDELERHWQRVHAPDEVKTGYTQDEEVAQ